MAYNPVWGFRPPDDLQEQMEQFAEANGLTNDDGDPDKSATLRELVRQSLEGSNRTTRQVLMDYVFVFVAVLLFGSFAVDLGIRVAAGIVTAAFGATFLFYLYRRGSYYIRIELVNKAEYERKQNSEPEE